MPSNQANFPGGVANAQPPMDWMESVGGHIVFHHGREVHIFPESLVQGLTQVVLVFKDGTAVNVTNQAAGNGPQTAPKEPENPQGV